jgi:MYXO-CTERM domain-containing protein
LIFGWIYQRYSPQAAFSWSAALALIAVAILTAVRRQRAAVADAPPPT